MSNYFKAELKASTTTAATKINQSEKSTSMRYMILELDECGTCLTKRRNNRTGYGLMMVKTKQFAKVEMAKVVQFEINTDSVCMDCPTCSKSARFNRIKWWGIGFEDGSSIYSDTKGKKKIEVSDIKDITADLLKYKADSIKDDIKSAEVKLRNLRKLNSSLKSIIKTKEK